MNEDSAPPRPCFADHGGPPVMQLRLLWAVAREQSLLTGTGSPHRRDQQDELEERGDRGEVRLMPKIRKERRLAA